MGCAASDQRHTDVMKSSVEASDLDVGTVVTSLTEVVHRGEDAAVLQCLQEGSTSFRSEVKFRFREVTGMTLLQACKNKLSTTAAFTAELLLLPKAEVTSDMLHRYLGEEVKEAQSLVVEIVCLNTEEEMTKVSQHYQGHHGQEIAEVIQRSEVISAGVRPALGALLKVKPASDVTASNAECARLLIEGATTSDLFTENGRFLVTIATKPLHDLCETFELFLRGCQRTLAAEVCKVFPPGADREGLELLVETIRTPRRRLAERVHELLSVDEAEQRMLLLYFLLTLTQEEVADLKHVYQTSYFVSLTEDVSDAVRDDVTRQTLLTVLQ